MAVKRVEVGPVTPTLSILKIGYTQKDYFITGEFLNIISFSMEPVLHRHINYFILGGINYTSWSLLWTSTNQAEQFHFQNLRCQNCH